MDPNNDIQTTLHTKRKTKNGFIETFLVKRKWHVNTTSPQTLRFCKRYNIFSVISDVRKVNSDVMHFRLNFVQTLLRFFREYGRSENWQSFPYSIFLNKLSDLWGKKVTPSYLTKSPPNSNFQNSFIFLRSYFMSFPFMQLFKHRIQYRSFLCSFFFRFLSRLFL
jgi:hypothetical protein